jgi:hypothetical protein
MDNDKTTQCPEDSQLTDSLIIKTPLQSETGTTGQQRFLMEFQFNKIWQSKCLDFNKHLACTCTP